MRTDAPGNFSCEIYIKSWELGFREGSTQLHIDNCPFCGPIVHGGTKEFPLSAADQAKKNIAARKKLGRRNFLKRSVIAASLLGITVLGFNQLTESESIIPNSTQNRLATDFSVLDAHYATLGRTRIENRLSHGIVARRISALNWIKERNHASMFDLICGSLRDQDVQVRLQAYRLLHEIDPVALKPHTSIIASSLPIIKRQQLKNAVNKLLDVIERS